MNILFCVYRDWAKRIVQEVKNHEKISKIYILESKSDFDKNFNSVSSKIDIIIFIGWSWIIPKEITDNYKCLGIHPSDLPQFRGGSPIQNQIIQGVTKTKTSLITLSDKLDGGDIWLKKDLDLQGDNIAEIFNNLVSSSVNLLTDFINQYPTIKPFEQDLSSGSYFPRRKSEQSQITYEDFSAKNLEDIYNFIRCLTDPYPNAFIEDKQGNRLFFTGVKYQKK